jgi:hypothetical protein
MLLALVPASAPDHFGASASALAMLILTASLVAFLVEARVRMAHLTHLAKKVAGAAAKHDTPLAAGPTVVFGPVELAEDQTVAGRVEVDQDGTEHESSGSWSTKWTETNRRVTMRPFYLRRRDERVRVEPGDRAFLVDDMDGMILVDATHRTRFAELSPGEEVFAVGTLELEHDPESPAGGYREASRAWVLRARPGEDLLLSSEPLDQRYRRRAAKHRTVSFVAMALLAAVGVIFSPYLARVTCGVDVIGTVKNQSTTTDAEGHATYHVWVELPDRTRLELDATCATHEVGTEVPVRYVRPWPGATDLGAGATVHEGIAVVGFFLLLAMALGRTFPGSDRAWYETKVVDALSGKLEDNARSTSM